MGRSMIRFYGAVPGAECVLTSHAILGCSGLDSVFLNCGVVFGGDDAESRFREFVGTMRARRVGGYVCLATAVQQRLEPLAAEVGLEPLPPVPLMARPAGPVAPGPTGGRPPCTVEQVADDQGLREFLAVSEAAFDLPRELYAQVVTPAVLEAPGVTVWVARRHGAAVAAACVVEDDGLFGVSGMATLPELQGRGIGGRLLGAMLEAHGAADHVFFLTSSEQGERLYRGHGFEVVDDATAWVVPPVD